MRKEKLIQHSADYQKKLNDLFDQIDFDVLEQITSTIIDVYKNEKTIYVAGNGGSAATASHYKVDFGFFVRYFKKKRIKVVSLTDHSPLMTAIGNDNSYDEVFTQQMQDYFSKGDVLIAISASGNSMNVVKAAEYANELGGTSIGLVGFEGGKLKDACKICLFTPNPKGDYGPIEDLHMIICHMLVSYLRQDEEFMSLYE
ncbi:MAG: SIS domain-containing protein [Balneolaceae bacterium]|nr:SIS domain-containing protein [Balneolaceae bacterium]MBO6546935.1 SIS domain-containing protein [Balneolaceae bacterium]MBO6649295.1 SIS domain-containing protein [Balneolaceae bacterium]